MLLVPFFLDIYIFIFELMFQIGMMPFPLSLSLSFPEIFVEDTDDIKAARWT